ncbi:hypothetical protein D3C77_316640 [compost metagenome]
MTGKCTKTLLDALLIADIGINCIEHAKLASILHRDEQPRHRHQAQQPDRLQGYRLATSIRAGNDDRCVVIAKLYINRNHLIGRNKRMTSFLQLQEPAVIHARQRRLHLSRQSGLSKYEVQLGQHVAVIAEKLGLLSHKRGQLLQDHFNFPFFL